MYALFLPSFFFFFNCADSGKRQKKVFLKAPKREMSRNERERERERKASYSYKDYKSTFSFAT